MADVTMIEEYAFVGAHRALINGNDRDQCMHGHTWTVEMHVVAPAGPGGYAFDHDVLDDVAEDVLSQIDHKVINDIPGLARGLNEDIAEWLYDRLVRSLLARTTTGALDHIVLGQLSGAASHRPVRAQSRDLMIIDHAAHTARLSRIRRRTRVLLRGRDLVSIAIDGPPWAAMEPVADYARALGLTAKWEAVGTDTPTMIADLFRLGRARGFTVLAFGNSFTVTFSDDASHTVSVGGTVEPSDSGHPGRGPRR